MHLKTLSVSVNCSSENDSWLNLSANPISAATARSRWRSTASCSPRPSLCSSTSAAPLRQRQRHPHQGRPHVRRRQHRTRQHRPVPDPAGLKDATKVPSSPRTRPTAAWAATPTTARCGTSRSPPCSSPSLRPTPSSATGSAGTPRPTPTASSTKAEVGPNAVGIFAGGINLVMVLLTPSVGCRLPALPDGQGPGRPHRARRPRRRVHPRRRRARVRRQPRPDAGHRCRHGSRRLGVVLPGP